MALAGASPETLAAGSRHRSADGGRYWRPGGARTCPACRFGGAAACFYAAGHRCSAGRRTRRLAVDTTARGSRPANGIERRSRRDSGGYSGRNDRRAQPTDALAPGTRTASAPLRA